MGEGRRRRRRSRLRAGPTDGPHLPLPSRGSKRAVCPEPACRPACEARGPGAGRHAAGPDYRGSYICTARFLSAPELISDEEINLLTGQIYGIQITIDPFSTQLIKTSGA